MFQIELLDDSFECFRQALVSENYFCKHHRTAWFPNGTSSLDAFPTFGICA